jgi:hypothetical protein
MQALNRTSLDVNQTQKDLRAIGYRVDNVDYWVATDRLDLSAEQ